MKLETYLQTKNISASEFARQIECSPQAVDRYRKGERTPRPEQMSRIIEATAGEVTPNDFLSDRIKRQTPSDFNLTEGKAA